MIKIDSNLISSDGWRDVQEVQVRDGDLGGTQRLRDEEGQDVHRQGAHEGHYPGNEIKIKIKLKKDFKLIMFRIFLWSFNVKMPTNWMRINSRRRWIRPEELSRVLTAANMTNILLTISHSRYGTGVRE